MSNFGELATQLVVEARRSTATDTLLKYNDQLVRAVIREQRDLDKLITALLAPLSASNDPESHIEPPPAVLLYQTALARNKRCLLAYHSQRLERIRDAYWAAGCALPALLGEGPLSLRSALSPHEADYARSYAGSVLAFRSAFAAELDIAAGIENPPRDLLIRVHVVRECGVIQTELGAIDFKLGQRFVVRAADVEHLIAQGYLEAA